MRFFQELVERPMLALVAIALVLLLVFWRDIRATLGKGTATAVKPFRQLQAGSDRLGAEAIVGALPKMEHEEE